MAALDRLLRGTDAAIERETHRAHVAGDDEDDPGHPETHLSAEGEALAEAMAPVRELRAALAALAAVHAVVRTRHLAASLLR